MRMEKATPSGRAAKKRMKTVATAAIMPYITLDGGLIGEVTGSVNMKVAPNKTPPLSNEYKVKSHGFTLLFKPKTLKPTIKDKNVNVPK